MNLFFKSAVIGTVAAIAAGVLAFALARFFDAVGAYMEPAAFLMPVIGRIIPLRADWVIPSGGPPAGVLLMMVCTLLFWAVIFGGSYFAWTKLKHKRSMQQTLG